MEPTTLITGANALKLATSAFDYLKNRVKGAQDVAKLIELQQAFDALREENRRLREDISRRDAQAGERGRYQRKSIGSAVVLVREEPDGSDGPPCCPNPKCADDSGEPPSLQGLGRRTRLGTHMCPACHMTFTLR